MDYKKLVDKNRMIILFKIKMFVCLKLLEGYFIIKNIILSWNIYY